MDHDIPSDLAKPRPSGRISFLAGAVIGALLFLGCSVLLYVAVVSP